MPILYHNKHAHQTRCRLHQFQNWRSRALQARLSAWLQHNTTPLLSCRPLPVTHTQHARVTVKFSRQDLDACRSQCLHFASNTCGLQYLTLNSVNCNRGFIELSQGPTRMIFALPAVSGNLKKQASCCSGMPEVLLNDMIMLAQFWPVGSIWSCQQGRECKTVQEMLDPVLTGHNKLSAATISVWDVQGNVLQQNWYASRCAIFSVACMLTCSCIAALEGFRGRTHAVWIVFNPDIAELWDTHTTVQAVWDTIMWCVGLCAT